MSEKTQELPAPKMNLEITHDLSVVRTIIGEMVNALNEGPRSRERSLVITKLQEAEMWALQAQAHE
ncbi:MAG: hypothetical protein WBV94_09790 [Blastocatellia bacterium]